MKDMGLNFKAPRKLWESFKHRKDTMRIVLLKRLLWSQSVGRRASRRANENSGIVLKNQLLPTRPQSDL